METPGTDPRTGTSRLLATATVFQSSHRQRRTGEKKEKNHGLYVDGLDG